MVGVAGFRAHASRLLCQVRVGAEQVTVCQLPDLWIRRVGNLFYLLPSLFLLVCCLGLMAGSTHRVGRRETPWTSNNRANSDYGCQ